MVLFATSLYSQGTAGLAKAFQMLTGANSKQLIQLTGGDRAEV